MVEYNFNFKNSIFNKELIKEARQNAIRRESQKDISAQDVNEITNYLEGKCNNAGIFKDLTDEEIESRLKAEEQSPLKLIKNLINNKHKIDSSGVNNVTNQGKDLGEIDSSRVNPPQNDVLPTAGAIEDSETVLIPNDVDSGVSQQLETEFTPESVDSGVSQPLETEFTPTPVENRANATTSVSISDTDGAKQLTLAVGDKLNVTYVYKEKTFNYTIEAQSSQEITLQTEDGYLSVLGNNLAVQTGDVQYSNIALVGTTNSLRIGTNGKTYNANSIAYNSAEGGHSIYTWGDPPEPEADFKMLRGETKTITVTQEEQILELTNPFDAQKHYYTLKMRDDITPASNSVVDFTKQNVEFKFLENGRLVVTGNYVDIEAMEGQKDDLIILGHFNKITTGDEDDIVRVGYVMDDLGNNYKLTSASTTYEDGSQGNYYYSDSTKGAGRGTFAADGTFTPTYYAAVGNQIFTGGGDDHVTMLMNKRDVRFRVDMGEGYDSFGNVSGLGITISTQQAGYIKNAELAPSTIWGPETIDNCGNSLRDGNDGWARQGGSIPSGHGICAFLGFLNSICNSADNKLSDFVDIVDNGLTYTVTFKNYKYQDYGTQNSISVLKSEINDSTIFNEVRGDIDTVALTYAFEKILAINKDRNKTNVWGAQYSGVFARYFFGIDNPQCMNDNNCLSLNNLTQKQITNLFNHYKAGNIHDIGIGFRKNAYSIGQYSGHEYTLKAIGYANGEMYLELINPWDDRDCVKLSYEYLSSQDIEIHSYTCDKTTFEQYANTEYCPE